MGESNVIYRRMVKDDLPRVAEIELTCFRSPWSERMLRAELHNKVAHYVVMEIGGEIAGYLGMWILFDEAHVTNVAVMPEYRRKGHGKRQMINGMVHALSHAATQMTLEVRQSNVAAQAMYFSLGFELEGIRKKYYQDTGEDALLLWNKDIRGTVAEHRRLAGIEEKRL